MHNDGCDPVLPFVDQQDELSPSAVAQAHGARVEALRIVGLEVTKIVGDQHIGALRETGGRDAGVLAVMHGDLVTTGQQEPGLFTGGTEGRQIRQGRDEVDDGPRRGAAPRRDTQDGVERFVIQDELDPDPVPASSGRQTDQS